MRRRSLHVEPHGPLEIARHYVRELIYAANDGIITTFAVVAGVAGGGLSLPVVLILGTANLFGTRRARNSSCSSAARKYARDYGPI